MSDPRPQRSDLLRLATYLHGRVGAILQCWRDAVDADPTIPAAATLARAQFVDHVPRILAAFEEQLRARGEAEQTAAADAQREGAADHGVHRWLHGYHYRETMREWGHLQLCLSHEIEAFTLAEPNLDPHAMSAARHLRPADPATTPRRLAHALSWPYCLSESADTAAGVSRRSI